jgi:prepilin-type N-terminal cleavage/methylation domain-containing protein
MRHQQRGFTLIEIAIVLVIIGLLLGGVLKGQELINSAKVKNMATDLRNIPIFIYGYQDKFKRLPGDDKSADANVGAPATHIGDGDGTIEGDWNATAIANESVMFWEHVRRANLASGSTDFSTTTAVTAAMPTNAEGGRVGVSGKKPITSMVGASYYVCSDSIDGKFSRQLDLTMDDGVANTGTLQGVAQTTAGASNADGANAGAAPATGVPSGYADGTRYTVCLSL